MLIFGIVVVAFVMITRDFLICFSYKADMWSGAVEQSEDPDEDENDTNEKGDLKSKVIKGVRHPPPRANNSM